MFDVSYEDLLSGEKIFLNGVGWVRSPFLWELKPGKNISIQEYRVLVNILGTDKDQAVRLVTDKNQKSLGKLAEDDKFCVFDILTIRDEMRKVLIASLRFFTEADVKWNEHARSFSLLFQDGYIGTVDRNNFDDVREVILHLNYRSLHIASTSTKFSSEVDRKIWERVQEYESESNAHQDSDSTLAIANVISKLCIFSHSYNLMNVYDLTVYQLYDQYFQCLAKRRYDLETRIFSIHGGDQFDFQACTKPITTE